MSGGQDPATWDYEIETSENLPNPLVVAVRRYLVEVDRCNAVEIYRLRNEMRKLTNTDLCTRVSKPRSL